MKYQLKASFNTLSELKVIHLLYLPLALEEYAKPPLSLSCELFRINSHAFLILTSVLSAPSSARMRNCHIVPLYLAV
jgi:hypothetical protein